MTRRQRDPLRALTEKERIAGQANCGRCGSKTECVYGFKVALMVDPKGVTTSLRLASANCDERPIGDILLSEERHDACLADKGFSSLAWEWHWLEDYGALVAATPKHNSRRTWRKEDRRWAASKWQAWPDTKIADALEVSRSTVARVRERFAAEGLEAALLQRKPKRTKPKKLDDSQEAHLIALACSEPPRGRKRWSVRLLAERFVELECAQGEPISRELVRRTLKKVP